MARLAAGTGYWSAYETDEGSSPTLFAKAAIELPRRPISALIANLSAISAANEVE